MGKKCIPIQLLPKQNRTQKIKNWGETHISLKSEFIGTFLIFQSSGETALKGIMLAIFFLRFFYIHICVNHPVQQSQATFSPSLHVADLENKSFHRFSASRQEIPFEYILKGNANVSRIEMISTIFQPKKTLWI